MNGKRAVTAGLVATALMTGLLLLAPLIGLPRLAIGNLLSTVLAVSVAHTSLSPAAGWVCHFAFGVLLALIYAGLFVQKVPGSPAKRGALFGFLVFLLAQVTFMPLVGAGIFSRGDLHMLAGSLLGHLVYGGTLGAIYGVGDTTKQGRPSPTASAAVIVLFLVLGIAAPARAQGAASAAGVAPQGADTAVVTDEVLDAGRKIFHGRGTCHACHGDQLQGGPIAPSLRGPKWRHIDGTFASILDRVRTGYSGTVMVAHPGDIDDKQTVQVATYIWAVSQGKTKP